MYTCTGPTDPSPAADCKLSSEESDRVISLRSFFCMHWNQRIDNNKRTRISCCTVKHLVVHRGKYTAAEIENGSCGMTTCQKPNQCASVPMDECRTKYFMTSAADQLSLATYSDHVMRNCCRAIYIPTCPPHPTSAMYSIDIRLPNNRAHSPISDRITQSY